MRPFSSTISLTRALEIVGGSVTPIERRELVALDRAAGRVLAVDVVAGADVPPFARSAMDGYAVRAADTAPATRDAPVRLRMIGALFTGELGGSAVNAGECVEIATGAPIPPGADAVVMVEHVTRAPDGSVVLVAPAAPGQHVGRQGADIAAGQVVLRGGMRLDPARVGALAALGLAEVDVYARPRVFVASSGNELRLPGQPLDRAHIYDINRFTLAAVVREHGGDVVAGQTAGDTIEALRETLRAAEAGHADVVVLSGGSSVGDRDLIVDAVAERGEVLFHGIAVKPGKPTLFARLGGALLLGMPGNPTSCLSNAYILLIPLLRAMARLPPWQPRRVETRLSAAVRNSSGRHTFFTVRLEGDAAVPAFKGSGEITSLAHADGYIEIPADVEHLDAGTRVLVTLF
jgi:molybdenum cofactor synthesis domain-containing protein